MRMWAPVLAGKHNISSNKKRFILWEICKTDALGSNKLGSLLTIDN
jgi:hypothetical protein